MWDWAIWAALAVAAVAGATAAGQLGVAVLRFFRGLKRVRRRIFRELDEVAAAAERAGERAAELGPGGARLERSLAGLAASRRRLAVLQSALDEATDAFAWLALVPRRK
jgi:hypothetical protein